MKKAIGLFFLVVCLMSGLPMKAAAENRGSIQVKLDAGDLPVINGAVTLYQVGVKVEEGYRIMEAFGGGIVRQADADSDYLARWLAESADTDGLTLLLDADGNAIFTDLEEGLYMLVQTERIDGFYPIYPALLTIPQTDIWDLPFYRAPVPVVTEIPRTGESPIPFLGAVGMVISSLGLLICIRKERKQ